GEVREVPEYIGTLERDVRESVRRHVAPRQLQRRLGGIDAENLARAGLRGVEAEAARVAECVEDALAATQTSDCGAVVALIEVVAGFLPLGEVYEDPQPVLGDGQVGRRRFAPERTIV